MFFFGTFSHFIPYSLLLVFYLTYFIVNLTVKPTDDEHTEVEDKINFVTTEKNKLQTSFHKKKIISFKGMKKFKKPIRSLFTYTSPYYFIVYQKSKLPVVFSYIKTFYFNCFLYQRPPPFS